MNRNEQIEYIMASKLNYDLDEVDTVGIHLMGRDELDDLHDEVDAILSVKTLDDRHLCGKCGTYLCFGKC